MNKLRELQDSLAQKVQQQHNMLETAKTEGRDLTPEESSVFDGLETEIVDLEGQITAEKAKIEREQKVTDRLRTLNSTEGQPWRPFYDDVQTPKKDNAGFKNLGEFVDAIRFGDPKGRIDSLAKGPSGGVAVPEAFRSALLPTRNELSVSGTEGDGVTLVPPQYLTNIMMLAAQSGIVRPQASVIPADENTPDATVSVPALDQTGTKGVFGGVQVTWINEGDAKPDTTPSFKEVTLTPYEVAATVTVTDKLLRNWNAAQSFISNLLRSAMMASEDMAFIGGDGTGKPTGIIGAAGAITVNRGTANQITYDDVVKMTASLYSESQSTAFWVANQSVLPQLTTIKDAVGNYIFIRGDATRGIPNTLMGMPIIFTGRNAPLGSKGDLILADFSKYLIKDGAGPFIAASPHVLFQQNKTMIKVFWNVDGKPWVLGPMTLEDGSTKVSPFVILDVPAS